MKNPLLNLEDSFSGHVFDIQKILTVYQNDFTKNYHFPGEKHDFWELVYVDSGEVEVTADDKTYQLKKDDIIFHKPNEFHSISGNKQVASSVVIISFVCESISMSLFENVIIKATHEHRKIIGKFIAEAKNVFKSDLGRVYDPSNRLEEAMFGSEQMMYMYLSQLLILLKRTDENKKMTRKSGLLKRQFENDVVNDIIKYLEKNMSEVITLDDICNTFYLSKTYLKRMFKKETGYTVMSYLKEIRMEKAKHLIREEKLNMSEIAKFVGFDSLSYFSSSFKNHVGLSPSAYLTSIKKFEESTY